MNAFTHPTGPGGGPRPSPLWSQQSGDAADQEVAQRRSAGAWQVPVARCRPGDAPMVLLGLRQK
jgi:hypothetical protein